MTEAVLVHNRDLNDYRPIIGEERIDEIRSLARPLKGARVLHLNATAEGGGVAEILKSLVPLMNDVGLEAEWRILKGEDEFFQVTKAMHNGLQGNPLALESSMEKTWIHYNNLNAESLSCNGTYDYVIIHDPQPAGVLRFLKNGNGHDLKGHWVWRCHIDLSTPNLNYWNFLKPYVEEHHAAIFSKEQYVQQDIKEFRRFEMAPSIDPFNIKNMPIDDEQVLAVLKKHNIDPERPFIFKLSRYDPWKDFYGIIDIFDILKKDVPDVQLVLAGGGADDDPEAWSCYQQVLAHAKGKKDIHAIWGHNGVGHPEVNAFRQAASVVVQKSKREGFGLVVSEALWKGCPVVASDVGGINLQVLHDETGYLARNTEEWVEAIKNLLCDREAALKLGTNGKEHVRERFLITRQLHDYLGIFKSLANGTAA
jgi:trehalose synthase